MKLVTLVSSLILAASMTVSDNVIEEPDDSTSGNLLTVTAEEEAHLESLLFHNPDVKPIAIDAIKVIELEEELTFDFNTQDYLPENFNPLKGKHDLDWSKIELIELEEELTFNFNVKDYLPKHFNPHACIKTKMVCSK
ncbi:hypothetical protein [Hanstruepera marina]|uniref:hypothetical protein n=1 Tax=Hanstruepera marina TaxID=2873265 RepID=UPI001CA7496A|nr:hypothetical protein [Hanstruepera marina]